MQENNMITIKNRAHDTFDLNNDYTLPDYITDVRKLVRCDSKVILHNVYQNDTVMTFEGEVVYSILIICEDDTIKNIIYSEDFSRNSTVGEDENNAVHDCRLENTSARLISPRKLNCKSKIVITTKNNNQEKITPEFSGAGMPAAQYSVEKQQKEYTCMSIAECKVTNQHASRDVEISTDKEEIENIVYCKVDTCINEQKVSEGKLYLRGESNVDILYETVNGGYKKICDKFPFSEIIDDECEADGYICEVTTQDIKATVRNNTFGEMRLIELDYTYDIRCRGYREHTAELVSDIYSTEYDVVCQYKEISPYRLNRVFSSSLSINDTRPMEEITDEDISTIIDCNSAVISFSLSCDAENRRAVISGDIKFDLVCKADKYHHISLICPYKYEREYDGTGDDVYEEHTVKVLTSSAVIDKGRLILNAELYFGVMIANAKKHKYISDIEFTKCDTGDSSPLIIYYPKADDSLWDIAKKFKSTCDDIRSVNSLPSDSLSDVKVLLLPKKKQRSVFNRII